MISTFTLNVLMSLIKGNFGDLSNPSLTNFGKFSVEILNLNEQRLKKNHLMFFPIENIIPMVRVAHISSHGCSRWPFRCFVQSFQH